MTRRRGLELGTGALAVLALALAGPSLAGAALPTVGVTAKTVPLANIGAHRGVTVTATCPAGARLTGGGSWLRRESDPAALPTNGLVLGGTLTSTGAAPVDLAVADGAADPASWMSIANYTGVSEGGNQASTFALCATAGGPSHTVVEVVSKTPAVANQETEPPSPAIATCPAGSRLIGGGAATNTPDQVNDGITVGNNGNLKPLGNYPSDAAGVPAADGTRDATSWSAFGSAGIPAPATDAVLAYALCSTDPDAPPVQVARTDVDGPDGQPGTTPIEAAATCPAGTRLLGGGYRIDETVAGVGSGLQPQQGYHMRGSYPSVPGTAVAPDPGPPVVPPVPALALADGAENPTAWTALVQAGGQSLSSGKRMTNHAFAMCATPPPEPDSADLALTLTDEPDPVVAGQTLTYTLTVANAGPSAAPDVALEQALPGGVAFVSATATAGTCTHASGTVSCALGSLAPGAETVVTVKVTPPAPGTLTSSASVSSGVADANGANNARSVTTAAQLPQRAPTALSGRATAATATLGAPIAAEATLTGAAAPGGTVTFALYGPGDGGCAAPITTSTAAVSGSGTYGSAPYSTSATGTYRWIARYGGDGANLPSATGCGDAAQAVSVKAAPTLSATAFAAPASGAAITASATIAGGTLLDGTITFRVFGPGDDGCATPLATATAPVAGNGIYAAPAFTASGPGTYRWTAQYGGNADNFAAGPTPCDDPAAAVVVAAPPPPPAPGQAAPPPPPPPPPARPPAAPSNAFTLASAKAGALGRIAVRLRSPGPGRLRVTATARRGRASYRFGARSLTVRARGTVAFSIAPGPRARRDLRRGRLRVSLTIAFRPTGGRERTRRTLVVVKPIGRT